MHMHTYKTYTYKYPHILIYHEIIGHSMSRNNQIRVYLKLFLSFFPSAYTFPTSLSLLP